MFILRRITSENLERNTVLGEGYLFIDPENGQRNKDDFDKMADIYKWDVSEVYGFVSNHNGSEQIPLYKKSAYFVMMSNGQTFANISKR